MYISKCKLPYFPQWVNIDLIGNVYYYYYKITLRLESFITLCSNFYSILFSSLSLPFNRLNTSDLSILQNKTIFITNPIG